MNHSRESILARVRSGLAPLQKRAPLPDWDRELVTLRQSRGDSDLWTLFAERLLAVSGTPFATVADLVAFLSDKDYRHGYCDPVLWTKLSAAFPATFTVETTFDRARLDDYQFGITAACGAIAETGSVMLSDGATSSRLGALAPWVHIATLRRDQLFADISAALAALPADPNIVWCTGPSRTADVEGILIQGVHGPGVQAVLLLD